MPCKSLGFSLLFMVVLVAGCGENHHTVHAHSQRDLAQTFERGFPVITLSFAGDTMMDWSVKEAINQHGANYPFEEVATFFREDDYTLINLETAVTDSLKKEEKQYTFKSEPHSLAGLKNSGVDMVSLANNHAMDFGTEGLLDTMNHLEESGLQYIGAGKSEKDAYMGVQKTIKGKEFAFLGFSQVLPSVSWYASENQPGIASGYQIERMESIIKSYRKDVDFILVFMHWGTEKQSLPNQWQIQTAQALSAAGADIIIGSHPHVIQGYEQHEDTFIAYSLGNFLFPDYVTGESALSTILQLKISPRNGLTHQFIPLEIKDNKIIKVDHPNFENWLANRTPK